MNVFIKETKQIQNLELIQPENNIDLTNDFIGGYGAFGDGKFIYDDELDAFICDQETFDWWNEIITNQQALLYKIQKLNEKYGKDVVDKVIESSSMGLVDLEDEASYVDSELNEAFGE